MENRTNQAGQQSSASSQNNPSASNQNTSSAQSRSQNASASSQQQGQPSYTSQSQSQQSPSAQQQSQTSSRNQQPQGNQQQDRQGQQSGGMLGGITSKLSNIQVPQAVKDFGSSVSRSYGGLTTTQKVVGGAALALGASYWAAKSSGWVGQGKGVNKNRNKSGR